MDRNQADDLNDRMRERGLDRSGAPDSNATSESLVGDSMRAGAPRADAPRDDVVDVDRAARETRRDDINPGDEIGEAVGGISGVLTGAALGSLGGPIGTIIGGIAGAVSGWWAGRAISEAASHATGDDDEYYRTHFDSARGSTASRDYDDVKPAYHLGHIAGRNPDYQSRSFDEVERDLRHGWTSDVSTRHGQWDEVRDYARHAYERGRTTGSSTTGMRDANASMGGTGAAVGGGVGDALTRGAQGARNAIDDLKDRVDGNPASRPGPDATDSMSRTGGMGAGSSSLGGGMGTGAAVGGAMGGAAAMGGSLRNAADDLKDRVDMNPASRPGPDATDASSRLTGGMSAGTTGAGMGSGSGLSPSGLGGGSTGSALGNSVDDLKDRVDMNPASRPGLDATDSAHRANTAGSLGDRAGNPLENAWDKTKNAAHRAADRVEDALDDAKDRVDGNPSSRPGLDRTDDPDRRF
ncbi:hypothetical protein [Roseisolibacter sp. H3M3-2]|uniref:hypothetical protein n=1 Tax=Roseisolibacter sp. H3M3-2 TaxID=3031323 RepID=UPI0023DB5D33|nr:hypothetical protein [Roseisolibacter sp. H3M3-2]MDF1502935.1 hypothetical protein [Roseisolibacter sp. H3M3-2]